MGTFCCPLVLARAIRGIDRFVYRISAVCLPNFHPILPASAVVSRDSAVFPPGSAAAASDGRSAAVLPQFCRDSFTVLPGGVTVVCRSSAAVLPLFAPFYRSAAILPLFCRYSAGVLPRRVVVRWAQTCFSSSSAAATAQQRRRRRQAKKAGEDDDGQGGEARCCVGCVSAVGESSKRQTEWARDFCARTTVARSLARSLARCAGGDGAGSRRHGPADKGEDSANSVRCVCARTKGGRRRQCSGIPPLASREGATRRPQSRPERGGQVAAATEGEKEEGQ